MNQVTFLFLSYRKMLLVPSIVGFRADGNRIIGKVANIRFLLIQLILFSSKYGCLLPLSAINSLLCYNNLTSFCR